MPPSRRSKIGQLALAVCFGLAAAFLFQPGASTAGEFEQGRRIYFGACVACHGSDGAGAMPETPDLTVPDGPLSKPDAVLLRGIIEGAGGNPSSPLMPPKGGDPTLTEEDARHVLEFMRAEFGPTCPSGRRCDSRTQE